MELQKGEFMEGHREAYERCIHTHTGADACVHRYAVGTSVFIRSPS